MYIVFEGIVGSGKSTQSKKLTLHLQKKYPKKKVVWTKEPGGTEIADSIRKLVQGTKFNEEMHPLCDVYLYAASRAHSVPTVVLPILNKKGIVVSDRSFITSLVNNGLMAGLGIKQVLGINGPIISLKIPDVVIYIDVKVKTALKRLSDKDGDKWESMGEAFYKKARGGYLAVSKLPILKKKWITINGNQTEEKVFAEILSKLKL